MEEKIKTNKLPENLRTKTETLLQIRGNLKRFEEKLEQEKIECNSELLQIAETTGCKSIVGPDSFVTISSKITKSLNSSLLTNEILNFITPFVTKEEIENISKALTGRQMNFILSESYDEKLGKPFVKFSFNKKE